MLPMYRHFVWRILRKGVRQGRVLDLGTGTGLLPIELARAKRCQFQIVGIDLSADMVARAAENARKAGVGDRISFQVADAAIIPFKDRTFDLVVSNASLHHWRDPVAVFDEVQRVVKEDGAFMIRDGRRLPRNLLWRAFLRLVGLVLGMNQKQRQNWLKAIMAGYTSAEVRKFLENSRLKNWRLGTDLMFIDLCIESK